MKSLTEKFKNTSSLAARFGVDWFLLALIAMIVAARFWPGPGIQEGTFSLSQIARYGVSGIFFLYGLKLSPEKLRAGLSSWKVHIVVQLSTFLLFPLIILPSYPLYQGTEHELLWLGIFYLAALPSTVSSSVVMVSIAGGNIPAAIFNASISSLAGIIITPLWMGVFLTANPEAFDFLNVFGSLLIQVLVPVILGLILNRYWGAFAERQKTKLKFFDQFVILLIIYTSFSDSFAQDMFSGISKSDLLLLGGAMLALFFLVYGIMHFISKLLKFSQADQSTTIFCGSKKSLVHGTVMSKVLFPDPTIIGVVLLPTMVYHAMQLLITSIVARKIARKKTLQA
ncbi:bile acid:sodium symporter family protein [Cytophagaceae bacterium ABcell3]|nr:bile acid:sodium symporter family protein [Cytophagaceae bacterium ABcell3]